MFYELVRSSSNLQSMAVTAAAIIIAFVVGIGFHEFSHVLVAYLLGDTNRSRYGPVDAQPVAPSRSIRLDDAAAGGFRLGQAGARQSLID